MDNQIERVSRNETKLFASFCIAASILSFILIPISMWAALVFAIVGVALFVLDYYFNLKMSGVALFGLIVSSFVIICFIVVVIIDIVDPFELVKFEIWLDRSLGLDFVYPFFKF